MFVRPIWGGSEPLPTYIVQDTFTDTNGVLIPSHTPDIDTVGGGWTDSFGNTPKPTIQSNQFDNTNTGASSQHVIDSGQADLIIEATLVTTSTPAAGVFASILGRVTGSTAWVLRFAQSEIVILDNTNIRANVTLSTGMQTGVARTLRFVFSGTSISGTIDGVDEVTWTSSVRQSATSIGIKAKGLWKIDNFVAWVP